MSEEEDLIHRRWLREQKKKKQTPLEKWSIFISKRRYASQKMRGPIQGGCPSPWAKFNECITELADYAAELEIKLKALQIAPPED